jgi:hypothetical protein
MSTSVQDWLKQKGWDGQAADFEVRGGRKATVERAETRSTSGQLDRWSISEPTEDGRTRFTTQLTLAESGLTLAVYCELSAALLENALTPLYVETRCPTVIKTLIRPGSEWFYGVSKLAPSALRAPGREQGEILVRVLQDTTRPLPVVVVSSHNGQTIQRGIGAAIASDLAGLATVVEADDEAMWEVSRALGREWSCYMGAIRLYWPLPIPGSNPAQHPLWTASRLLGDALSVEEAAGRLRNYLRQRLMSVSVFAVGRPTIIDTLQDEWANEQRAEMLARARSTNEWQELAESILQERDALQATADGLENENDTLRQRVYLLQTQATQAGGQSDDQLAPDVAPASLSQAVQQARLELVGRVVFGRDVERGVTALNPDAGPPQKVLEYLRALGDMVDERRKGPLGDSPIGWLEDMGVTASGESETDRKNTATMKRRQWHDGTQIRQFETHLKPNDALSPDRCVRIYFDWDDATRQVVVGWVGRHPD